MKQKLSQLIKKILPGKGSFHDLQRIKERQQKKEDRQKTEKEAYFLWEADGKPEGKDDYYRTLAEHKIKTEKSLINKVKKVLVNNLGQILVRGVTILTILAAFGAFALNTRQKEFDRFSLVKPLFEVEQLDNKSKLKLLNHGGLVFFVGCEKNKVFMNKLVRTPKQYSSLSKTKSLEFIFNKEIEINEGDCFICYYRDADVNVYELEIFYRKDAPNTKTNSKNFYIRKAAPVYRSDLFVTMSRKWLDTIVSFIFPKDWFEEHKILKVRFKDCEEYREGKYKLDKIDKCLKVKYSNSDG